MSDPKEQTPKFLNRPAAFEYLGLSLKKGRILEEADPTFPLPVDLLGTGRAHYRVADLDQWASAVPTSIVRRSNPRVNASAKKASARSVELRAARKAAEARAARMKERR